MSRRRRRVESGKIFISHQERSLFFMNHDEWRYLSRFLLRESSWWCTPLDERGKTGKMLRWFGIDSPITHDACVLRKKFFFILVKEDPCLSSSLSHFRASSFARMYLSPVVIWRALCLLSSWTIKAMQREISFDSLWDEWKRKFNRLSKKDAKTRQEKASLPRHKSAPFR